MKKEALVTGGNSGIGFATARLLKERGYEVTITGRDADRVATAAHTLGVTGVVANMSDADALSKLAERFSERGLDVLVSNAGTGRFIPLGYYTEEQFADAMKVNVWGPLFLIQALAGALEKRKGAISFVSSVASQHGTPNTVFYAATKGALDAATRSLALELAPRHIRVNAVAPGIIATEIFAKGGLPQEQLPMFLEQVTAGVPMKRLGTPEEVAEVIVAQAESGYVTGSIWRVDGGVDA